MPSCVLKIDKDRNIKKWFDVPRNEYTGEARAMGIEFGPDGDLYLVDNAGWTGEPHMVFTGRILRLRLNDAGVVKCTVVADNMAEQAEVPEQAEVVGTGKDEKTSVPETTEEKTEASGDSWEEDEELKLYGTADQDVDENGQVQAAASYNLDTVISQTVSWKQKTN